MCDSNCIAHRGGIARFGPLSSAPRNLVYVPYLMGNSHNSAANNPAKSIFCSPVLFTKATGITKMTKTTQTAMSKGAHCWISGNYGDQKSEKGAFAGAPNLFKLLGFRFVHHAKGAQIVAILWQSRSQFRTILCKYPFSNAPFSKFLKKPWK